MLSSLPATSFAEFADELRKSSYPSPPDMTKVVGVLVALPAAGLEGVTPFPAGALVGQFSSTLVRNRTCPVWPYEIPVRLDTMCCSPLVELPTGKFRRTPALVPIHSRSLQANKEVMRRHADLCWRIMSSQVDSILFTGLLTSNSKSSSWLKGKQEN